MRPDHIQMLFVDGLGLPPEPLAASIYAGLPALERLLSPPCCVPLDACLGVPGTPQSATGQTAIFTGVNAAARLGRHSEGFPGPELRAIIESGNLFSRLRQAGRRCTFANAYATRPGSTFPLLFRSVTTVMTLHALGTTRNRDEMLAGQAVFHDITRHTLHEHGYDDIPLVSEAEAAGHLLAVLRTVDVSLFEYFLTDRAGHRGTPDERRRVLTALDAFIGAFLAAMDPRHELLLMVSDHGNIELQNARGHSCHPVPWSAVGCGAAEALAGMTSILQVTPRVLQLAGVSAEDETAG
ncbi:MAG: hypothetical protein GX595_19335 [Lentisphaerae bacterium]|nr:hypothetical protein [Lentisphaerota bacterium]